MGRRGRTVDLGGKESSMDRWIKSALRAASLLLCAGLSLPAAAQTIDDATDAEVVAAMEARSDLGTSAPDLYGLDISGVPVSLDNLRGKWVYVDFWATWCKPCMKELPSVVKLSRDLQRLHGRQGLLRHRLDTHSPIGQRATQCIPRPSLPRTTHRVTITGHSRLLPDMPNLESNTPAAHRRSCIQRPSTHREVP